MCTQLTLIERYGLQVQIIAAFLSQSTGCIAKLAAQLAPPHLQNPRSATGIFISIFCDDL